MAAFTVGTGFTPWPVNTTTPGQSQVTNPSLTVALYVQALDSGGVIVSAVKVQPNTTSPIDFPAGGTVRAYAGLGLTSVTVV